MAYTISMKFVPYTMALRSDMPFAVDSGDGDGKKYTESIDEYNLYEYLATDQHLYEILKSNLRKLYMDIDKVHWTKDQLNEAIVELSSLVESELQITLNPNELVVLVGQGESITSVHLIFSGVVMEYKDQHALIDQLNDQLHFVLDPTVYSANRLFRCVNQSKMNGTPLVFYTDHNQIDFDLLDTLINRTDSDGVEYTPKGKPKKTKRAFLTPRGVIENFLQIRYREIFESNKGCFWKHITQILYEFPETYPMDDWLRLSSNTRYSYQDNLEYAATLNGRFHDDDRYLYVLLNTKLDQDVIYERATSTQMNLLVHLKTYFPDDTIEFILKSVYHSDDLDPKPFTYNEQKFEIDLKSGFLTGPNFKINLFYDAMDVVEYEQILFLPNLSEARVKLNEFFTSKDKLYILKSAWGTGKTHHIVKEAVRHYKDHRILIVTSSNTLNTTNTNDLNEHLKQLQCSDRFVSHMDNVRLSGKTKVVCSIQSIGKLNEKQFDVVFIDEFESVMGAFYGYETFKSTVSDSFYKLHSILKKSKKIIVLDADISQPKITLLQDMLNTSSLVYKNETLSFQSVQFRLHTNTLKDYYKQIAQETCRLVIPCATRVCAYSILQVLGNLMEHDGAFKKDTKNIEYIASIKTHYNPNKRILYIDSRGVKIYVSNGSYHEATTYKREDVFQNIGAFIICQHIDVFIYTPTITTGISVNELYFDKSYAISSEHSLNTLVFVQMLMRVRQYKLDEVHVWIDSKLFLRSGRQVDPEVIAKSVRSRARFINEMRVVSRQGTVTDELRAIVQNYHETGEVMLINDPYVKLQMINVADHQNTKNNFVYNFIHTLKYHKLKYIYDTSASKLADDSIQLNINKETMKRIEYDEWSAVKSMNMKAFVVEYARRRLESTRCPNPCLADWFLPPSEDPSYMKTYKLIHIVHLRRQSRCVDECFNLLEVKDDTLENRIVGVQQLLEDYVSPNSTRQESVVLKPMSEWIHTMSYDDTLLEELLRSYDNYSLWDIYVYQHKFGGLMFARHLSSETTLNHTSDYTEKDKVKIDKYLLKTLLDAFGIDLNHPRKIDLTNNEFKQILYPLKSKWSELNNYIFANAKKSKNPSNTPDYCYFKSALKQIDYTVNYESKNTTRPNDVMSIQPNSTTNGDSHTLKDTCFIDYRLHIREPRNQIVFTNQSRPMEPITNFTPLTKDEQQNILSRKRSRDKDLKTVCCTMLMEGRHDYNKKLCRPELIEGLHDYTFVFKDYFYNPLMYSVFKPTDESAELVLRSKNKNVNRNVKKTSVSLQHEEIIIYDNGVRSTKIISRPYRYIRPNMNIKKVTHDEDEIREFCSDFVNKIINIVLLHVEFDERSQPKVRAGY